MSPTRFVTGLSGGGVVRAMYMPWAFHAPRGRSLPIVATAGLRVGFGARQIMAHGCTSGHRVCGLTRLSTPSRIATLTMASQDTPAEPQEA